MQKIQKKKKKKKKNEDKKVHSQGPSTITNNFHHA